MDQRPHDLPDPSALRAAMPILAPGPRPEPAGAGPGRRHPGRAPGRGGRRAGRLRRQPCHQRGRRGRLRHPGRAMVDEIIRRRGLHAPPAEPDDHDAPVDLDPPPSLDLRAEEVSSVPAAPGWPRGAWSRASVTCASSARRASTTSRTVMGTPASSAASTSVTSSGFPPVSARSPAAGRPNLLASSATAASDSGSSRRRSTTSGASLPRTMESGWSTATSSSR
jgi:hypothetical protein